ncbi:MAG TPA: 3-deoxy-D-arabino-heptulosonate 7-phosphate synthase [bacterium]|nr:3-deoxy-D-arabino-heptulosonate 7-phosphate synthase [bacterium]
MIIPKERHLTPEQEAELSAVTGEFGITLQKIAGETRSVYAMVGDERDELLVKRVEGLDYIDRVDTIQKPYKLMAKDSELGRHSVRLNGLTIGNGHFTVVAGHCTIDPKNPDYFYETAAAVKEAGGDILRGGVWKPRTSPHSFQGDHRSMDILIEAKARTGLPVDTEVMDSEQLDLALEAGVDMLQVGARNALNYGLLKEIGRKIAGRPTIVLLKRGMHMGKVDEFILAAEYVVSGGNPNIVLTPRGTVPTMDGFRNHPDESITVLLKEKTWAPVLVDPSHSVGRSAYVPFAACAAAAYGADGLIVESHVAPVKGIGDDPKQAVTPEVLYKLIRDARAIHAMQKEHVAHIIANA